MESSTCDAIPSQATCAAPKATGRRRDGDFRADASLFRQRPSITNAAPKASRADTCAAPKSVSASATCNARRSRPASEASCAAPCNARRSRPAPNSVSALDPDALQRPSITTSVQGFVRRARQRSSITISVQICVRRALHAQSTTTSVQVAPFFFFKTPCNAVVDNDAARYECTHKEFLRHSCDKKGGVLLIATQTDPKSNCGLFLDSCDELGLHAKGTCIYLLIRTFRECSAPDTTRSW
jgi:hypothetical protein